MQILILVVQIHANYMLNIGAKISQYFEMVRAGAMYVNFITNATSINWDSSFIIADTLDDHQSFEHVSPPPGDNIIELNASVDNYPSIKSASYNNTTLNKTRSKLQKMSDKGI